MRKLILAMLLMCGTVMAFADAAKWTDNFPQAVAGAKKEKKPILMLFTGSDWCPYSGWMKRRLPSRSSRNS